jgi:TRAP-type C4-dicarboxylate transport system permease small subunit
MEETRKPELVHKPVSAEEFEHANVLGSEQMLGISVHPYESASPMYESPSPALVMPEDQAALKPISGKEFEPEAEVVDLSPHAFIEDWVTAVLFWLMTLTVFLQFFTRYALSDPFAWTEEIARYFLMAIVFVGAAMCVRRDRHIHVDILYRFLPQRAGRAVATLVDVVRVVFFGYATWLTWVLARQIGEESMTMIDLPMWVVYAFILFGFAMMFLRSIRIAWTNWRRGYSVLERPELLH